MDKPLLLKLAKRIKELRKANGFSQDELAYRAEIGRSTLGNIETAQNDVTFSKLNKIAKAFNLSLAEFLITITFSGICGDSVEKCFKTYIYIIPSLFVLGIIETETANKIFHKDSFINIKITDKYIRYTYYILFWSGIIASTYHIYYHIWSLTR